MDKTQRVVLMQGAEAPQFANYQQFLLQEGLIAQIFTAAKNEADRLALEAKQLTGPAPAVAPPAALPLLTNADIILNAVTKLGSYFMSNCEIGGITLTADGEQFVNAVANQLSDAAVLVLPARRVPQSADFSSTLEKIAQRTIEADSQAAALSTKAQATKQQAEDEDVEEKEKLHNAAKLYEQAAAVLPPRETNSF